MTSSGAFFIMYICSYMCEHWRTAFPTRHASIPLPHITTFDHSGDVEDGTMTQLARSISVQGSVLQYRESSKRMSSLASMRTSISWLVASWCEFEEQGFRSHALLLLLFAHDVQRSGFVFVVVGGCYSLHLIFKAFVRGIPAWSPPSSQPSSTLVTVSTHWLKPWMSS